MSLKIRAVREKGNLDKERIVLESDSNDDIGKYVLFNTQYHDDETVSNDPRSALWLPDCKVGAGDLIVIYTKSSSQHLKEKKNEDNTKTFFIYWGKSQSVWNQGKDCAVLLKVDDWITKVI